MNARRQLRRGGAGDGISPGQVISALLRMVVAIALIAPVAGSASHAHAQDTQGSSELEAKLDSRGTLMLRNATLADWAFAIKQEWGINIVSGANLQNEVVDAGFENAPLRDILSEILFVRGYGFQAVGNSLRIVKLEAMGVMRPGFETAILPLDLLQPAEVEPTVKMWSSTGATVQAVPSSRSLIVIDTPAQIKKIQAHLEVLENNARKHAQQQQVAAGPATDAPQVAIQASGPRVFSIQFLKADEIVATVETVVPDGHVAAMKSENRLIVSGPADQLLAAEHLLKQIDVARQQVRITALLYDVDLEVLEKFGINWSHAGKGRLNASGDPNSLFALSANNFTMPATAAATTAGSTAATAVTSTSLGALATLTSLSSHLDISTVIRALDTTDGSRLLARPNVIAYDRIEAKFQSVSEIPVQQLTQTSAGGNIGTTSFREAGITLTVTPSIMKDGTVKMDVTPEFSVLAGFQSGQPIIDRRSATTTIHLLDGQTTVIGGLLRRTELEKQTGLPALSKMKYIGVLFRDHDTTVSESELLVFIKAEIIPLGGGMTPRDEAAGAVGEDLLAQIPYASHSPITPYCGDPFCPYHHPRPWGSALPPSACTACAEGKASFHGADYDPDYYAIPTPADDILPIPAHSATDETAEGPPPVVVDEARRRRSDSQRSAMRRLPSVAGGQATRTATRTQPRLPSQLARPVAPPSSELRTANAPARPLPSTSPTERRPVEPVGQANAAPWWKKMF